MRTIDDQAVCALLFDHGALNLEQIREHTGLSESAAAEVVRRLCEKGIARTTGRTDGTGRDTGADAFALEPGYARAAAVSVREPDLLTVSVVDLDGADHFIEELRVDFVAAPPEQIVTATVARTGLDRIGHVQLALPGAYDSEEDLVSHIDIPAFEGRGLAERLSERTGTGVAIENDVNLAATAEASAAGDGGGFALAWIGAEGIGLGIVVDRTILRGARGAAGEIGYAPVGMPGAKQGTLQEVVGGPTIRSLAAAHGIPTGNAARAVAAAVEEGKWAFLEALGERVAFALAIVVAVLDPARLVLGGEIPRCGSEVLRGFVEDALAGRGFACPVTLSAVSGDAVLAGARLQSLRAVRRRVLDSLAV